MQRYLPSDLCTLTLKISNIWNWQEHIDRLNQEYRSTWSPRTSNGTLQYRTSSMLLNAFPLNQILPDGPDDAIIKIPGITSGHRTPKRWAWSSPELTRNRHWTVQT